MTHFLHALTSRLRHRKAERELRGLPDHLLKDMGLSRSEIPYFVRTGNAGD